MKFAKKRGLHVCLSLDVEEEGLFSGRYQARNPGLRNVDYLRRLASLSLELGFPLTLFCSWAVLANAKARETLAFMRDKCGAEIAAHLHHWSTPPFEERRDEDSPARTHALPRALLEARLAELLKAGKDFQGAPLESFRMGRWDLKAPLLPLLADAGIKVDSSICPLRAFQNGADHFLAPADPYWQELGNGQRILEAPITQIPLAPRLARAWHFLAKNSPLLDSFHFWGALSANPMWHGPRAMRWASRLHSLRGGRVLNFFLHSSELMPCGSPHVPNEAAAQAVLAKIFSFCAWLKDTFDVAGLRTCELPPLMRQDKIVHYSQPGDWHIRPGGSGD